MASTAATPDPAPDKPSAPDPPSSSEAPADSAPQRPEQPASDPLGSIASMWTGWLSPTPAATTADTSKNGDASKEGPSGSPAMTSAAATANEWLAGAGRMWETAVADVGTKLKEATSSVDTAALGQQVDVFRQRSGQFVEDVSKSVQSMNLSLEPSELQKRAEVISSSTKGLLEKAGQSLQKGRQEALEIFVDSSPHAAEQQAMAVAPWDKAALPEGEHKYADTLRQEMLKIVVDAIYSKKKRLDLFLSGAAEKNSYKFNFDANAGMAMAALDADKNMRRLRAGLVPGKMKEDAFWTVYFYHVHRIRQTLVANDGVMPEIASDVESEDPAALFADDGEGEELAALDAPAGGTPANGESQGVVRKDGEGNTDDEIDAIFDEE